MTPPTEPGGPPVQAPVVLAHSLLPSTKGCAWMPAGLGAGGNHMRILGIVALGAVLGGCAGSPMADAIAGPEKLAQQDDAYCKSIGLNFGTSQYADCRMVQSQAREERHARAQASGDALLAAGAAVAAAQPQPAMVQPAPLPNILPQQTRCTTYGATTNCTTY
jgi:hypothetical protein